MNGGPSFYNSIKGLEYEYNCTEICVNHWNKLMEGHRRASRTELKRILKRLNMRPELRKFFTGNPYDHHRTETHIIFVWSAIEYFYKIKRED
jgi:hypothetical protein